MATGISSPLALGGLFPSVDGGYVAANGKPFTSVSNAESALNGFPSKLSEACVGLTVLVKESSWPKAKEYWVQPYDNNGVTAYHLEEKLGSQAEQKQSDWNQDDENEKDFIKNKPTKLSQFTNDAGYAELNQVAAALANKVDKINDKQLSTEDFTTALKQKLESMPTISVNGDVLIINGKEYKLSPVPVVADYYIGWDTGSKSDFAAKTDAQILELATGYNVKSNPTYHRAFGSNNIFFLLYQNQLLPTKVVFTSQNIDQVQDIQEDNSCPHADIVIEGVTYKVFGIRMVTGYDQTDSITINYE